MKTILTLLFVATISLNVFSQDKKTEYAYILIEGKMFSKKLLVKVDFGDTPEQIENGKQYSKALTDKKSYAAILNYMSENRFELVESLDYMTILSGTGETSGVVFIMKRVSNLKPD